MNFGAKNNTNECNASCFQIAECCKSSAKVTKSCEITLHRIEKCCRNSSFHDVIKVEIASPHVHIPSYFLLMGIFTKEFGKVFKEDSLEMIYMAEKKSSLNFQSIKQMLEVQSQGLDLGLNIVKSY